MSANPINNTLAVEGDFNLSTVNAFISKFEESSLDQAENFVLDLSKAKNIDSASVAFCLHCSRTLNDLGQKVLLKSPNNRLLALLKEYKIEQLFEIV